MSHSQHSFLTETRHIDTAIGISHDFPGPNSPRLGHDQQRAMQIHEQTHQLQFSG